MLLDETCFFLAADFDKTTWQDDTVKKRLEFREMMLSVNVALRCFQGL